mmetsp:Transcript_27017/g.62885  ORF Transcript_27017/g.62885 Transcript_27017/m.62885 type:complete len:403 (+) Transcript_27017:51-1259(+)
MSGAHVSYQEVPTEQARSRPNMLQEDSTAPLQGPAREHEATCKDHVRALMENPSSGAAALALHYFIMLIILVSTFCVIIETVPEVSGNPLFLPAEMCFTALFTAEFALRLYACESVTEFATNGFNIIDFLAVFPGYMSLLGVMLRQDTHEDHSFAHIGKAAKPMRSLRMVRIVRLVRVFRVMRVCKVARHSESLAVTFMVFLKVSQSGLAVVLMLMGFATILSSSLVYLFESDLCDQSVLHCVGPTAFTSIPAAFWWATATLTTVGYGDMVPQSAAGKVIGAFTAVAGLVVVAIGIALVSLNFKQCFAEEKAKLVLDKMQRRTKRSVLFSQEGEEIDEKLATFQLKSQELLRHIRSLSQEQEEKMHLKAMLGVLESHAEGLISDVKVFKTGILAMPASEPRA